MASSDDNGEGRGLLWPILGDWRQDCFRAILHRFWNGCAFHLRQLIVESAIKAVLEILVS